MCIRDRAESPPTGPADAVEELPRPRSRESAANGIDPEPIGLAHYPSRSPALRKEGPTRPQSEPVQP
eukprot:93893-Alexandrium_andersonii.AAC.1